MQNGLRNSRTDFLVRAMLSVQTAEECYALLADLFTIREVQDMAQRMEVAKLLRDKTTYVEIASKTGMSTATISRVNRALMYGAGGYELVLSRLEGEEEDQKHD